MNITFTMSVRDEFPELLNALARQYGREEEFEESAPIDLMIQVECPAVPRKGEMVWISEDASPREVERIEWGLKSGGVRVSLQELDADEMGDERSVVEYLLISPYVGLNRPLASRGVEGRPTLLLGTSKLPATTSRRPKSAG